MTNALSAHICAISSTTRRHVRERGFSLIELMVTIAVVAILLGVALPSFAETLARNRIASTANDLMAGMNLARLEAIRRNATAGVCASKSGTACDGGTWDTHWVVFVGTKAEPQVLRQGDVSSKDTLVAESDLVLFDARGQLSSKPQSFSLQPKECDAGKPMRRALKLNRTGNVTLSREACV